MERGKEDGKGREGRETWERRGKNKGKGERRKEGNRVRGRGEKRKRDRPSWKGLKGQKVRKVLEIRLEMRAWWAKRETFVEKKKGGK